MAKTCSLFQLWETVLTFSQWRVSQFQPQKFGGKTQQWGSRAFEYAQSSTFGQFFVHFFFVKYRSKDEFWAIWRLSATSVSPFKVKNRSRPIRGRKNRLRQKFKKPVGHTIRLCPRTPQKKIQPSRPQAVEKIFNKRLKGGCAGLPKPQRELISNNRQSA